jgi:hypothetical protein
MALTARASAVACLLLALAASAAGAGSHSPAPAPAVDCFAAASSLIDCMGYVSPGSTEKTPSKACCGEVKTAVANPTTVSCLCTLAGSKDFPVPIDMKRVLALPGACGASNAAFSKCHSEHRRAFPPPLLLLHGPWACFLLAFQHTMRVQET